MYFDPDYIFKTDRIVPFSIILDEVFYKSSIEDMRRQYFQFNFQNAAWLLLSDYYFGKEKQNRVITFTALPYLGSLHELQNLIKEVAPKDIKHTRNVSHEFIDLLHQIPSLNISFTFNKTLKYLIWKNQDDFLNDMMIYTYVLEAYQRHWLENEPVNENRLQTLSKNIRIIRECVQHKRKVSVLCEAFCISFLGGYVGSLLSRETQLKSLIWMSDRDRSNELGENLVRDLFQINLINITKHNVDFMFTRANSNSDEWYKELIRIPDYLTGTLSNFDLKGTNHELGKETVRKMLGLYFSENRRSSFIYNFLVTEEGLKVERYLIRRNA